MAKFGFKNPQRLLILPKISIKFSNEMTLTFLDELFYARVLK